MLELKDIKKDYPAGGETVKALKGITLQFRESEFVSILGPSGCGKTTLLNIIGGLDQYTSGDLIINGTSTIKEKCIFPVQCGNSHYRVYLRRAWRISYLFVVYSCQFNPTSFYRY